MQQVDMYVRGLLSRVIQHEVDHLDGRVVWDHPEIKVIEEKLTKELLDPDAMREWSE